MKLHELFLSPDSSNVDLGLQLLTTLSNVEAFEELMVAYNRTIVQESYKVSFPHTSSMSKNVNILFVMIQGQRSLALVISVSKDRWIWVVHNHFGISYVCLTKESNPLGKINPLLSVYTRQSLNGFIEELTNYINYETI